MPRRKAAAAGAGALIDEGGIVVTPRKQFISSARRSNADE